MTQLASGAFATPSLLHARRILIPALAIAWTLIWWWYATASGHHRDLVWWAADTANLYAGELATDGFYPYSPALLQILEPLRAMPWSVAVWAWAGLMLGGLAVSAGRWTPLAIIAPPVLGELIIGNLHLLFAGAIVLGFRWPQMWALMLLTKVTPGVGVLWFAVRREWRNLGLALGTTAAIAAVSFLIAPNLWSEWVTTLVKSSAAPPLPIQPNALFPVPLLLRLPVAALIVVWGARTNRRWVVPIAATLALPVIWTAGLATLVAVIALWGDRFATDPPPKARALPEAPAPAAAGLAPTG